MRFQTVFFPAVLLLTGSVLLGEVYLLGPKTGRKTGRKGFPESSFNELFERKKLMTERAVFNGYATYVEVSLIRRTLEDLLRELAIRYPDLKFRLTAAGAVGKIPRGKSSERILLVGQEDRVTVFTMELPEPAPGCRTWPPELPLPDGADPTEVIHIPGQKCLYGSFSGAAPGALPRTAGELRARGFMPVTGEAASSGGTGELFFNPKTRKLATLSIAADGTGTIILTAPDKVPENR